MEILIEDIPDEGLQVTATAATHGWLERTMLEVLSKEFTAKDAAELDLFCAKCDDDVDIDGNLLYTNHAVCDRCLKSYVDRNTLGIHLHLAPLRRKRGEARGDDEIVKDDLEFSFYEGDRFDIADIVREQLLLHQPMQHVCQPACQGLCQHCGKDLNLGPCHCKPTTADARWEPLKKLKLKKK
ncbi:MAG: DUF177 domain-containing protein [Deltaproteobacteria bacterium]|nr:DUF177 domain-containing protein [Deltaproteobacteria bacterium]